MHTIGRVKRVEDSKWDFQPEGFNNNIRWQAGHIFVTMEKFVQQSLPSYEVVNPEWMSLFDDGSNPEQWEAGVPKGEELLTALREQLEWIIPFLEGALDEKMAEPLIIGNNIMTIDSIDGIIQFLAWHEGTHSGVIDALNRLT